MTMAFGKKDCGFTLFELAISAALLGTLAATLLSKSIFYQDTADRAAAQQLVATLRTELQVRAAQIYSRGGTAGGLSPLLEENPFDWLAKKPDNYLGEYYSPNLEELPAGNWVFDRRDKTLVYLLNSHRSIYSNASNLLKFKVESVHSQEQTGLKSRPAEIPKGVVLAQLGDEAATDKD